MKLMKIIILFFALALSACASQPAYKAAVGDGSGYKEIALGDNHYRVQFKLRGHSRSAARDYALMRAAELTLAQGYDWFLVEKRTTRTLNDKTISPASSETIVTRDCGLLGCRTTSYKLPAPELDIPDTETLVLLDIRMGRGVRPEQETYDARETRENLEFKAK
jgi:hypothetical protein